MCPAVPTIIFFMGPILIVLLALAETGAQQPPAEEQPVFRAGVSLVRVDAQVMGRNRLAITGLKAEDFRIYDENQPQEITYFGREAEPLDLLLLLDVSGSMRRWLEQMAATARAALEQLHGEDRVAVMLFSRNTAVSEELTSDFKAVETEIRQAVRDQSLGSGTVINGSIIEAARFLSKQPVRGRRAILILTDNQSLNYQTPDEDVIRALWEADSVLNAIVAGKLTRPEPPRPGRELNPDFTPSDVWKLVDETGGEALEAGRVRDSFAQMIERIRGRYHLQYPAPESPPGQLRRIRVELSEKARQRFPDAIVRARSGYYTR
jgi:VWFA-related protein